MKAFTLLFFITTLFSCSLFDIDEKLLAQHQKSNGEKINIYYVGGNATTEENIQVKKENKDNPVWVNEKYNLLKSSKLINDTSLQLVLSDTGSSKFDTVIVKIK